jgi:hypothetical protein
VSKPGATAPNIVQLATDPVLPPFDHHEFLGRVHGLAFKAVTRLWKRRQLKAYGPRVAETLLTVFCHLVKGVAIVEDKRKKDAEKDKTDKDKASAAAVTDGTKKSEATAGEVPDPAAQVKFTCTDSNLDDPNAIENINFMIYEKLSILRKKKSFCEVRSPQQFRSHEKVGLN